MGSTGNFHEPTLGEIYRKLLDVHADVESCNNNLKTCNSRIDGLEKSITGTADGKVKGIRPWLVLLDAKVRSAVQQLEDRKGRSLGWRDRLQTAMLGVAGGVITWLITSQIDWKHFVGGKG